MQAWLPLAVQAWPPGPQAPLTAPGATARSVSDLDVRLL